jgi:hypothetical protein
VWGGAALVGLLRLMWAAAPWVGLGATLWLRATAAPHLQKGHGGMESQRRRQRRSQRHSAPAYGGGPSSGDGGWGGSLADTVDHTVELAEDVAHAAAEVPGNLSFLPFLNT